MYGLTFRKMPTDEMNYPSGRRVRTHESICRYWSTAHMMLYECANLTTAVGATTIWAVCNSKHVCQLLAGIQCMCGWKMVLSDWMEDRKGLNRIWGKAVRMPFKCQHKSDLPGTGCLLEIQSLLRSDDIFRWELTWFICVTCRTIPSAFATCVVNSCLMHWYASTPLGKRYNLP